MCKLRKTIMLALLALMPLLSNAQERLTGTILDGLTNSPISGASVYLDGTSHGVITDSLGRFVLSVDKPINTPLVVYQFSYESQTFADPWNNLPDTIVLTPREIELAEVEVVSDREYDPFLRKKKLEAFTAAFLGDAAKKRKCKILNEEVIDIYFSVYQCALIARSTEPIRVRNPYLGYDLEFDLHEFTINYRRPTDKEIEKAKYYFDVTPYSLAPGWIRRTNIVGSVTFKDTASKGFQKVFNQRKEVYQGSLNRFLRALAYGNPEDEGYRLWEPKEPMKPEMNNEDYFLDYLFFMRTAAQDKKGREIEFKPVKGEQVFAIEGTESMRNLRLRKKENYLPEVEYRTVHKILMLEQKVGKDTYYSLITLFTDEFAVDSYGNPSDPRDIFLTGDMSYRRVADALPRDY